MATAEEQSAAKVEFEAAIHKYYSVIDYDDGLITDWILIVAQHIPEPDGGSSTGLSVRTRDGQPDFHTLGLLDHMVIRIKAMIAGVSDVNKRF